MVRNQGEISIRIQRRLKLKKGSKNSNSNFMAKIKRKRRMRYRVSQAVFQMCEPKAQKEREQPPKTRQIFKT